MGRIKATQWSYGQSWNEFRLHLFIDPDILDHSRIIQNTLRQHVVESHRSSRGRQSASRLIEFPIKIIIWAYDQCLQQIGSGRSSRWLSLAWQLVHRGSIRRLTTSLPAQDRPHSAQILAMLPQPSACNSMSEDKMASDGTSICRLATS